MPFSCWYAKLLLNARGTSAKYRLQLAGCTCAVFQATWALRQVFADERSAVIDGLPSEEDGEFFETAPAGAAALDFDAMERDASAPSAPAPDAGAALEGL